jgi:casein kinase 1
MLSNTPVAIKFVRATYVPYYLPFLIEPQEPRKSDAPQLRDEFRSYRTLNGTRTLVHEYSIKSQH